MNSLINAFHLVAEKRRIMEIKMRRFWIYTSSLLLFILLFIDALNLDIKWAALIWIIAAILGIPLNTNMAVGWRDISKILLFFWILVSGVMFYLVFPGAVFNWDEFQQFVFTDFVITLILLLGVIFFLVLPFKILTIIDKKTHSIKYNPDQAASYIYEHLDDRTAEKVTQKEIGDFLYKARQRTFFPKEFANKPSPTLNLTPSAMEQVWALEAQYRQIIGF